MKTRIAGSPAFAHIHVELEPGEAVVAEAGAMASMAAEIEMETVLKGSLVSCLLKRLLGRKSLFLNVFRNCSTEQRKIVLTQRTPGDIREISLSGCSVLLQPGAFVASTPDVQLRLRWAGIRSWFAGEGLFKVHAQGNGSIWFGGFGGVVMLQERSPSALPA